MKVFGCIFALFGLVFVAIGGGMAFKQHRKIQHAQSTTATILSTDIERHTSTDSDGHTSTTYKPIVNYRYVVDGKTYECGDPLPLSIKSGHAWARRIVRQFKVGATVDAFYDSANPSKAFLLARYSFFPYIFILFPSIFIAVGIGVALAGGASTRRPPRPVARNDGWFELAPRWRIAARRRAAAIGTVAWFGFGFSASGHYFAVAKPPYETLALVLTGIYAGIGLIGVGMWLYYGRLGRNLRDATVYIDRDSLAAGDALTIGARQEMLDSRLVQKVSMGLVCAATTKTSSGGKTTISTSNCYERLDAVLENQRATAGETLNYAGQVTVPDDQPASTEPGDKGYPRYRWSIRLDVDIDDCPDYRADFPVRVVSASD